MSEPNVRNGKCPCGNTLFVEKNPGQWICGECDLKSPGDVVLSREDVERLRAGNDGLGKWMSAALDDPSVCGEMKADINAWFDTFTLLDESVKGKP